MSIERYDLDEEDVSRVTMVRDDGGPWVGFAEHSTIVCELDQKLTAAEKALKDLRDAILSIRDDVDNAATDADTAYREI